MPEKNITEEWSEVTGETQKALCTYYVPLAMLAV